MKNESSRPVVPPRNDKAGVNPPSTVAATTRIKNDVPVAPTQQAPKVTQTERPKDDQPPTTRVNSNSGPPEPSRGKEPAGNDKDASSHPPQAASTNGTTAESRQAVPPPRPNKRGREEDNRNQSNPNPPSQPVIAPNPDKGRPPKPLPPPRNPQTSR